MNKKIEGNATDALSLLKQQDLNGAFLSAVETARRFDTSVVVKRDGRIQELSADEAAAGAADPKKHN